MGFAPTWITHVKSTQTNTDEHRQKSVCAIRVFSVADYGVTRKMPHSPLSNWKDDCVR